MEVLVLFLATTIGFSSITSSSKRRISSRSICLYLSLVSCDSTHFTLNLDDVTAAMMASFESKTFLNHCLMELSTASARPAVIDRSGFIALVFMIAAKIGNRAP